MHYPDNNISGLGSSPVNNQPIPQNTNKQSKVSAEKAFKKLRDTLRIQSASSSKAAKVLSARGATKAVKSKVKANESKSSSKLKKAKKLLGNVAGAQLKKIKNIKVGLSKLLGIQKTKVLKDTKVETVAVYEKPLPKSFQEFEKRIKEIENQIKTSHDNPYLKNEKIRMEYLRKNGPLSAKSFADSFNYKKEAALKVVESLYSPHNKGVYRAERQDAEGKSVDALKERLQQSIIKHIDKYANNLDKLTDKKRNELYKNLDKELCTIIHPYTTNRTKGDIMRGLTTMHKYHMASIPKEIEEEKLVFSDKDNQPVMFTNKLTPVTSIWNIDYSDVKPLGGASVRYIPSSLQTTKHVTNLHTTEVLDASGNKIFQAFRHGTLCAFGISDNDKRLQANKERAIELITTMIKADPSIADNIKNNEIAIPIISTSLETPDDVKLPRPVGSNERRHVREHIEAWKAVQKEGFDLEINGNKVHVKPQVITFNFGVNSFALRKHFSKVMMSWKNVRSANKEGMEALFGEEFLKVPGRTTLGGAVLEALNNITDDAKKSQILKLSLQIIQMYNDESYKSQRGDPYKMVARIGVLSNMIGHVTSFNCKSGKDRTSQMDAESKYLATTIHLTGEVPEPSAELSDKQRADLQKFVYSKLNFGVQKSSIGKSGYKLSGNEWTGLPKLTGRITGGISYLKRMYNGK